MSEDVGLRIAHAVHKRVGGTIWPHAIELCGVPHSLDEDCWNDDRVSRWAIPAGRIFHMALGVQRIICHYLSASIMPLSIHLVVRGVKVHSIPASPGMVSDK